MLDEKKIVGGNNYPEVSILVPVYGVEKYIERCARSVFRQTYPNLKYVFVDDCSPDTSIDILKRVMDDYPERAKQTLIIRHSENKGLAETRNTLVDNCVTEWLMHLDSDDWVEDNIIELLVNKQQETNADIVISDFIYHYKKGESVFHYKEFEKKEDYLKMVLQDNDSHSVSWKLIRKSLYVDNNIRVLPEGSNAEDWQASVPLFYYAEKICTLNKACGHYDCSRPMSLTKKTPDSIERFVKSVLTSLLHVKKFLNDKEDSYQDIFSRTLFDRIMQYMAVCAFLGRKDLFCMLKSHAKDIVSEKPYLFKGVKKNMLIKMKYNYLIYRNFMKWLYRNNQQTPFS